MCCYWIGLDLCMEKILLVEDDLSYQRLIKNFLTKKGYHVTACVKKDEAVKVLNTNDFSLLITDYWLPDGTGLDLLKYVRPKFKNLQVIFISNYSEVRIAVKAMKIGAFEYITKPINPDELLVTIRQALNTPQFLPSQPLETKFVVGKSPVFEKVYKHLELVAPTDLSVLLIGETGTGKEYLARRIHALSNRREGPFVAVDCGAISPELASSEFFGHVKGAFTGAVLDKIGYLEFADGGTLFLDEIGNLLPEIQSKLLRALQEKKIKKVGSNQELPLNIRLVSATNEDIGNPDYQGNFRLDLFHRINEFKIDVPPLRDRWEDLDLFIQHFILISNEQFQKEVTGLEKEVEHLFFRHSWPGNLRELKNVIRRAVLLAEGPLITKDLLPVEFENRPEENFLPTNQNDSTFKEQTADMEQKLILEALEKHKFNKSKAAAYLGIDRKTLYLKIKRYGLDN